MTNTILWGQHPAHGPQWLKLCDNPSRTTMEVRRGDGWTLAVCSPGVHPQDVCDICKGSIGSTTLKGLCGRCAKLLESGKASARIVVAESKAMVAERGRK